MVGRYPAAPPGRAGGCGWGGGFPVQRCRPLHHRPGPERGWRQGHELAMFKDLRDFIKHLESSGELARIKLPVSRDLEITEIADRVMKGPASRNKALLFENVSGFDMPVAINLFGTEA